VLGLGFGSLAQWVVYTSFNKTRMKGFDPFQVVDAFELGHYLSLGRTLLMHETWDGKVLHRQASSMG
jgi:hypothetical protein